MGQPNLPKMKLAIGRYAKRSNCQKPTSLVIFYIYNKLHLIMNIRLYGKSVIKNEN